MKLILAQGNSGAEYESNRHNVGFFLLDTIAKKYSVDFLKKTKFFSEIAEFSHAGEKILLAKPTTFYNETGQAARLITDFYKISPENILVLHDDLALPFGTIRTRFGGSPAGNNGIKSLNSHLGEAFWRLRIGVSNEQRTVMGDADFVLANFTINEKNALKKNILAECDVLIELFLDEKIIATSYYELTP